MTTICLCMIVKNESKVLKRLFDSIVDIIDCYCICDTGSTDDTISIIESHFKEKNISGKVVKEEFKDFSHNRNIALNAANGMSDYILLLDADMVIKMHSNFKEVLKTEFDEFKILQGNDEYNYPNTRIIRNNGTYKYHGVTHEYVIGPPTAKGINIAKDIIFIIDIGDGGAKRDKFERDIKLLTQGIIDEPNNTRYYFYLGNSYLDIHNNDLAIEVYKKVLELNGWEQEKYVSCLRIYEAYLRKNEEENGLPYLILSQKLDNKRIEGIYRLIRYYSTRQMDIVSYTYYSLIQTYYETEFLSNDSNIKYDQAIHFKLFTNAIEYKYLLPYYMIIVSNKIKMPKIGIRMYEIIFSLKYIDAGELCANNIIFNLQFFIDEIDRENLPNFYTLYTNYLKLLTEKFNITYKELLQLYETKLTNTIKDNELKDNLIVENPDVIVANAIIKADLNIGKPIKHKKGHNHNKFILTLMIKNESKIIERCIGNVIQHIDAISILDTGSTDTTIEVCNNILIKYGKPFNIMVEPFKNFGYNRSVAFTNAKNFCIDLQWDLDKTYAMVLDADMILKVSDEFKDFELTQNGYQIIQKNSRITYYNVRMMKFQHDWKCTGATHEYWDGGSVEKLPQELIHIHDINDGGCKSDKAERDIRLLKEDIAEDKNMARSHFYLAQTYKDTGQFSTAIEYYKKRIELGGWYEEIWYSHYQLGKCYKELNQVHDMEYWMNKAFDINSKRAEPIYFLVNYFRIISRHHKAYHYYLKGKDIPYPENELLFVEHNIYNGMFEYENTILACYLCKSRQDGLSDIVSYINKYPFHLNNVWDNLHYYVESLNSSYTKYNFPLFDEYAASSCSIINYNGSNILNIRLVNYSIDEQGCYHMRSADGKVRTKNAVILLDDNYLPITNAELIEEDYNRYDSNIEGLEDVRLFLFKDEIHFTATSKNITNDDHIVIAMGKYSYNDKKIYNVCAIEPPRPSRCEKNWIFIPEVAEVAEVAEIAEVIEEVAEVAEATNMTKISEATEGENTTTMNFIYGWHPLEIGSIKDNKLTLHTKYDTPVIFSRFRGSSPIVEYNNKFWAVVHFVRYTTPRVYYHSVVVFDKKMKPEQYSLPFCFRQTKIEYCLGFHIREGNGCFIFSENDSSPGFITMPLSALKMVNV